MCLDILETQDNIYTFVKMIIIILELNCCQRCINVTMVSFYPNAMMYEVKVIDSIIINDVFMFSELYISHMCLSVNRQCAALIDLVAKMWCFTVEPNCKFMISSMRDCQLDWSSMQSNYQVMHLSNRA